MFHGIGVVKHSVKHGLLRLHRIILVNDIPTGWKWDKIPDGLLAGKALAKPCEYEYKSQPFRLTGESF